MVHIAFFFLNDTAPTEIYTLSLHDALPIFRPSTRIAEPALMWQPGRAIPSGFEVPRQPAELETAGRSEEHTSELQSQSNLVCRLLLEKKKYSPLPRLIFLRTSDTSGTDVSA